jgi:hypothetical protein
MILYLKDLKILQAIKITNHLGKLKSNNTLSLTKKAFKVRS